ncbi:hypothetical protein [Pseudomonas sp. NPDC007930]|uniref:alpha/beta hydrolase n=1 Tax=Pseudomonas sp. NPDC007930 TaxID=3364417 RepID=UPI0036EFDF56
MTHHYPIIYIRGFAMRASERDETAADPFCGFNVGSTVYRAVESRNKLADKMVFESPVVRLMSEFQYQHVYQNGFDIMDGDWQPARDENGNVIPGIAPASIIILRYYDDGSDLLGDGRSRNVLEYAQKLNEVILTVRQRVAEYLHNGQQVMPEADFKCYLVAHSMGGLVARAFLQGAPLGLPHAYTEARATVDKFFTFATPHNGIDMLGMNVPYWFTAAQANTFNRNYMRDYLNLGNLSPAFNGRVDLIPSSAFPINRVFCMVGSNRGDYEVLKGAVRAFVGHGSDGLVRIDNASLWGVQTDPHGALVEGSQQPAATAYAYRSHSGYFGIVNSEEGYQNLTRFLFGDVRVDVYLEVSSVSLPQEVQDAVDDGRTLEAGYQFEFRAAPKGKRWFLTRRQSVEDSPACRSHEELTQPGHGPCTVYLSSVFLAKRAKVDKSPALSYAMAFAAKVPDYVIERRFWMDGHFEGADLFRGTAIVELTPPADAASTSPWHVKLWWLNANIDAVEAQVLFSANTPSFDIRLPFDQPDRPGISGCLRLTVQPWA